MKHLAPHLVPVARYVALVTSAMMAVAAVRADDEPAQKTRQQKVAEALAADAAPAAEKPKPAADRPVFTGKATILWAAPADAAPAAEKPKPAANRRILRVEPAIVVPGAAAEAGNPPNDALTQQWVQQFRPVLMAELNFIRQTCDLSGEQRPKIKAAGEASLRESVKSYAKIQQVNGGQFVINGRIQNAHPEVRAIIRKSLDQALRETLSPEQMACYEQESAARTAQRKRAAILCVVSRLDGAVYLSAEQREAIVGALDKAWNDAWEQWLSLSSYDAMYLPTIPDECVIPHLSDSQKSVWRGIPKIALNGGFNRGILQQEDDGWWGDAPAQPAKPAQPANKPAADLLRPFKLLLGIDK